MSAEELLLRREFVRDLQERERRAGFRLLIGAALTAVFAVGVAVGWLI